MLKVSVVIVNYNGQEDTKECIASLEDLHHDSQKIDIVIVDNGSKKRFELGKLKLKNDVRIIRNEENLGFSGGNNVGIRSALADGADYILLLNNDTVVDKNVLLELLNVNKEEKHVGIVAPKIYFASGFEFHKTRYKKRELGKVIWYAGGIMDWKNVIGRHRGVDEVDTGQFDTLQETDFASGCCLLISREVLGTVGMFDERYFLYYEESDLCERVKKARYKIVFQPRAVLWHKNAQTAGGSGSVLQDYYITRNRLLFGITYAPLRSILALLRESAKLLLRGRPWQKRGVKDFYIRRFGKGSFNGNH